MFLRKSIILLDSLKPFSMFVCSGESLPKFHHWLAAGPRGEGCAAVRHAGPHQLGRLRPSQDHQRGETQGEGQAAAKPLQRGQVTVLHCTLWSRNMASVQREGYHYCVFVFYHQVRGAASVPGCHGGADGAIRGQTPGRLQEDLSQRGRGEIRQVL